MKGVTTPELPVEMPARRGDTAKEEPQGSKLGGTTAFRPKPDGRLFFIHL